MMGIRCSAEVTLEDLAPYGRRTVDVGELGLVPGESITGCFSRNEKIAKCSVAANAVTVRTLACGKTTVHVQVRNVLGERFVCVNVNVV